MLPLRYTNTLIVEIRILRLSIVCLGISLLCFSHSVVADYKDDIDYTSLLVQLNGSAPSGNSIPVMHTEAAISFIDHDNNPATVDYPVYLPNDTDSQFSGKTITDKSNLSTGTYSGHATGVGKNIYGNVTSIAPDILTINTYWADHWLKNGFLNFGGGKPLSTENRVSNNSWIGSYDTNPNTSNALRRADWVIDTDEIIMCVGIKNNFNPNDSLLSGAFNAIAIGKSDGVNGFGTAQLDGDYVSGRTRPEIVVPLTTSSRATGVASAAASILIETSQTNPGLATDLVEPSTTNRNGDTIYNTERSEVIKSVLMAGAMRLTNNTTGNDITDYRIDIANKTLNGLDVRYGAGQLNIQNSYNIIIAGEQNSNEDDGGGIGSISDTGFDYDPSFGGDKGSNSTASYYFNTGSSDKFLTSTLVWNMKINGGSGLNNFSGTATFYDLDLTLYDITSGQTVVIDSTSVVDNTENIWILLHKNNSYMLQVTAKAGQNLFEWDYALAWKITQIPDSDGDGLNDEFETLIGTNPLLADTDGDGISDYDEVNWDGDPNDYDPANDLNPLSANTDGDSFTDAMEIDTGNNPLDSADFPVWGDINNDGLVNVIDVLLITRAALGELTLTGGQLVRGSVAPLVGGTPVYTPAISIDAADVLLIQRKALGEVSY